MKNSPINWTHHTFNCWQGCTRVSPECDNCYAVRFAARQGVKWGKGAPRRVMSDNYWREPLAWDRAAARAGERHRVFCASEADWADAEAPAGQLKRLWGLIRATPNLDWLLLTKRAGRIERSLPSDWGEGYANVWLGVSCGNRKRRCASR